MQQVFARAMVTSYGMSDKIGPVRLSDDDWESWSPQIRNMADNEVRDYLLDSEKELENCYMIKD